MNISELRRDLYSRYPGKKWKKRVDEMTDNQVIAVTRSIAEREQLKKNKESLPLQPSLFDNDNCCK